MHSSAAKRFRRDPLANGPRPNSCVTSRQIYSAGKPLIHGFRIMDNGDMVFRTLFGLSRRAFRVGPQHATGKQVFPDRQLRR